jgi:hypothetical protein
VLSFCPDLNVISEHMTGGTESIEEIWRPVRGWEGLYEVSNHGRVRRSAGSPRAKFSRVLSPGIWGHGYLHVHFRNREMQGDYSVHRLVADAFLGPIPATMQVNHLDGDKKNNHVSNLEVITQRENYDHAKRTGLYYSGPRPERSKLTETQIYEIRALAGQVKTAELAERYGVSKVTISGIARRALWGHLPDKTIAA